MAQTDTIQKVLILGGGPNEIGHDTEADSSTVQIISGLKKQGMKVLLIDNNPFSVALEEIQPANVFIQEVSVANVSRIIEKEAPDAILPILGGLQGIRVAQELQENGVLADQGISILGMPPETLRQLNNNTTLGHWLSSISEPMIEAEIVNSADEAFGLVRKIGFPVIIKPVAPRVEANRSLVENEMDLESALNDSFNQSRFQQATIEKSVVGYKEIELVVVRDVKGTQVLINSLENFDPVGVHSGDSIVFSPTQTLTDQEIQRLRDSALKIAQELRITGVLHVQFALDATTDTYYVIKINPYFDRSTALAARTTGYPIAAVVAQLILQVPLEEVKLPDDYAKQTALIAPMVDHVIARIPIWPFTEIPEADQHLDTMMKSVGSTLGIGRSVEEAILKALRSSQFSPRDVLPSLSSLSESELITQLIHPLSSRLPVLIEATRRGYQVDELAELTKIDAFYFQKIHHLLDLENLIKQHPQDPDVLRQARYYGFGEGMVAGMWNITPQAVRDIESANNIVPTYKQIEPTAGEFDQATAQFYSTFERENESFSDDSKPAALIVGRGGNQLGTNASADYFTTMMLKQLNKDGYRVILMNTNPNAVSLAPELSDKQYIDPIQLGDILNVIRLENPTRIFIPGNRHYLTDALQKRFNNVSILPPDQEQNRALPTHANVGVTLFATSTDYKLVGVMDLITSDEEHSSRHVTSLRLPSQLSNTITDRIVDEAVDQLKQSWMTGMVQLLFLVDGQEITFAGTRPSRLTEMAFLSKSTGINWVRMLTRQALNTLDTDKFRQLTLPSSHRRVAVMKGKFPFRQLDVDINQPTGAQEVGATLTFTSPQLADTETTN